MIASSILLGFQFNTFFAFEASVVWLLLSLSLKRAISFKKIAKNPQKKEGQKLIKRIQKKLKLKKEKVEKVKKSQKEKS